MEWSSVVGFPFYNEANAGRLLPRESRSKPTAPGKKMKPARGPGGWEKRERAVGRGTGRGVPGALSWSLGRDGAEAGQCGRSSERAHRHVWTWQQGTPAQFPEGKTERGPLQPRRPSAARCPRRTNPPCAMLHRPLLPAPSIAPSAALRGGCTGPRPETLQPPEARSVGTGLPGRRGAAGSRAQEGDQAQPRPWPQASCDLGQPLPALDFVSQWNTAKVTQSEWRA